MIIIPNLLPFFKNKVTWAGTKVKGNFECLPVTFKCEGPGWKTTSFTCFGALFIYFKMDKTLLFFFFSHCFWRCLVACGILYP